VKKLVQTSTHLFPYSINSLRNIKFFNLHITTVKIIKNFYFIADILIFTYTDLLN